MLDIRELLKEELTTEDYNKLIALDNPKLHAFIADAIGLTQPASVRIFTDAPEDMAYIRELAVRNGEEIPLTPFPNDIICNTLTALISSLKDVEGKIDSWDITVTA